MKHADSPTAAGSIMRRQHSSNSSSDASDLEIIDLPLNVEKPPAGPKLSLADFVVEKKPKRSKQKNNAAEKLDWVLV